MSDWKEFIGYGLAALTIILGTDKDYKQNRAAREKGISDLAAEKATLKSECQQMKGISEEIKGYVKENFRALASQLRTLEATMLKSDELLGDRITSVEVTVAGHTEAIKTLKDDVRDIKHNNGNGKKAS